MKPFPITKFCHPTCAVVLFLLLFALVEKGSGEILTTSPNGFIYELPTVSYKRGRSGALEVECAQHRLMANAGQPAVPVYFTNWAVGENAKLSVTNMVYDTLFLSAPLATVPDSVQGEDGQDGDQDWIVVVDTFVVRGVKALTVRVNPFRYEQETGRVIQLTRCEVHISSEPTTPVSLKPTFYNLLKKSFPNSEAYIKRSDRRAKENYLIIAESGFHDALAPLIAHREKEYRVTVVDAALLGGNQMIIINKIKELYNNPDTRPTYLLLVGGFPLLPMNNPISTSSLGTPLNDLWYGAVDGDDHYADILVGRFSLNSGEIEKVQNCVAKTISYENKGLETPKSNLYIAAGGPFAEHAIEPMNYVDGTYFVPGGYSSTRLFESDMDEITTEMVSAEVNSGLDFLFYSGHGNWDHWKTGHVFGKDVKTFTNTSYPIVFSFACLTGDLSTVMGECFGESWLNEAGGAVAFLGASTETTWEPDDHFQRMVVDGIFDTSITSLQGAIAYGKMSLDQNFPKYGTFYSETFNLCGDPALKVSVPGLKTAIEPGDKILKSNHNVPTVKSVNSGLHIRSANVMKNITLYTLQGREVLHKKVATTEVNVSILDIAKGVYTLKVTGDAPGARSIQKIVIR